MRGQYFAGIRLYKYKSIHKVHLKSQMTKYYARSKPSDDSSLAAKCITNKKEHHNSPSVTKE